MADKKELVTDEVITQSSDFDYNQQEHQNAEPSAKKEDVQKEVLVTDETLNESFEELQEESFEFNKDIDFIHENNKDKISGRLWLATFVLLIFVILSFSIYDTFISIKDVYLANPVYAIFLTVLTSGLVLVSSALIFREIKAFQQVKKIENFQEIYSSLNKKHDSSDLIAFYRNLAKHQKIHPLLISKNNEFFKKIRNSHTPLEITRIYQETVLVEVKSLSKKAIYDGAFNSAYVNLISPNRLIQTVFIFWINVRLLRKLASIYGFRPGLFGSVRLVVVITQNMLIQSQLDIVIEEMLKNMITNKFGFLVAKELSSAITSAALTNRLGKTFESLVDFSIIEDK